VGEIHWLIVWPWFVLVDRFQNRKCQYTDDLNQASPTPFMRFFKELVAILPSFINTVKFSKSFIYPQVMRIKINL
jgi:hypothetical protein